MKVVGKRAKKQGLGRVLATAGLASLCFGIGSAFAAGAGGSMNLGNVATTIQSSLQPVVNLIEMGSYVAGVGFAVVAMLKFKAHRDNPTQIPLGTPIALIFIAAGLMFLPSVFNAASKTLFGANTVSAASQASQGGGTP